MRKQIVLGSGCFWCTEAVFSRVNGVLKVTPGYAGGAKDNPSYEEVCTGKTGHAEVVLVEYDDSKVSITKLLEIFFKSHNPSSINRQGNDVGSQYRSIILFTGGGQEKAIRAHIRKLQPQLDKPIVTEVSRLSKFWQAEEYHKDYYAKHPLQPYCLFAITPKLKKLKGMNVL